MKFFKKLVFLLLLLAPVIGLASQNRNQSNCSDERCFQFDNAISNQGDSQQIQSENKNQNQVQTNTSGVGTRTQEEKNLQQEIQTSRPTYSPRSETARQHMSTVASAVESLIRFAARVENRGIGDQIREIAQLQGRSADRVNQVLDRVQQRSRIAEFFIGPNFNELKKLKQEIEQNRLRIQELQRIVFMLKNKNEQTVLQNQLQILESQNIALQKILEEKEKSFSLLGWLFRWVAKY